MARTKQTARKSTGPQPKKKARKASQKNEQAVGIVEKQSHYTMRTRKTVSNSPCVLLPIKQEETTVAQNSEQARGVLKPLEGHINVIHKEINGILDISKQITKNEESGKTKQKLQQSPPPPPPPAPQQQQLQKVLLPPSQEQKQAPAPQQKPLQQQLNLLLAAIELQKPLPAAPLQLQLNPPLAAPALQQNPPLGAPALQQKPPLAALALHQNPPLAAVALHQNPPLAALALHQNPPLAALALQQKPPLAAPTLHQNPPLVAPALQQIPLPVAIALQQQQQQCIIELEFNNKSLNRYCCVVCGYIFRLNYTAKYRHLREKRHLDNVIFQGSKITDLKNCLRKEIGQRPNMVKFYFRDKVIGCCCTICNSVYSNSYIFEQHLPLCNKQNEKLPAAKCELCRLEFNSNEDYDSHLKGINHKDLLLEIMVSECVKIIERTSDDLTKEEIQLSLQNEITKNNKMRKTEEETMDSRIIEKFRKIKDVHRSKQTENLINLNVVCCTKPTKSLFDRLYNTFVNGSKIQENHQLNIDSGNNGFYVIHKQNPQLKCYISLSFELQQQLVKVEVKSELIDEDVIIID